MITNRILLKDIPFNKFDSAIITTYSLNLYYLEQQVLPLLSRKNIHYISVLADSKMLSSQLEAYSFLSEQRKRNYALNGIQCKGAFHPKIIFLAGETDVLVLIGSGNLTSSGHGKNLEVWNPVYVNSDNDKKLGFIIQVWNYLKVLHADLGISAQNKLKSIEENCGLLAKSGTIKNSDSYEIDDHSKISFLVQRGGVSIFKQMSDIIGEETIHSISVMSPYYDSKGKLLHQLNERFNPKVINAFLQKDFGAPPFKMESKNNIRFYYWDNTENENIKQDYFHAKNIVFEGQNKSYLLSGSANASVAAFGSDHFEMVNEEACILYQSDTIDYKNLLSLDFNGDSIKIEDVDLVSSTSEASNTGIQNSVFIKTAERNYDDVTFYLTTEKLMTDCIIRFYDAKGVAVLNEKINIKKGESTFQIESQNKVALLYCEVFNRESSVSNKQFVIDINSFEGNNPSPNNRALNQARKLIETGSFSSLKIIGYLNTIYKHKAKKGSKISSKPDEEGEEDKGVITENNSELIYMSYEDIQQRIKRIDNSISDKAYVEYKSVRLWDSIFSYLRDNKERKEEKRIGEEETEDVNSSEGRTEKKRPKKKPISESVFQTRSKIINKYLLNYQKILESKIAKKDADKPNIIDLTMFLITLELLMDLLSQKESVIGRDEEMHLLEINFTQKQNSWSENVIHIIGLFTLWCSQKKGFNELDSYEYKHKLSLYKRNAFEASVSAIALFSAVNKTYNSQKVEIWRNLCLLNANLVFNDDHLIYKDTEAFSLFVPDDTVDEIGEANYIDEINESLQVVNANELSSSFYIHPLDGVTYIEKEIVNQKNNSLKYLKLFNTGYGLDDKIFNFWNGKVYSINESRWMNSRKD